MKYCLLTLAWEDVPRDCKQCSQNENCESLNYWKKQVEQEREHVRNMKQLAKEHGNPEISVPWVKMAEKMLAYAEKEAEEAGEIIMAKRGGAI